MTEESKVGLRHSLITNERIAPLVPVPDHLGKRLPHDIIIEQYGPSQWEDFEGSEEQNVRGVQELATRVNFFSGIPAVASVKGILHLYKYGTRDDANVMLLNTA